MLSSSQDQLKKNEKINVFEDAVLMHVTEKMPPFDLCNNHYQIQRSGRQKTVSFVLHASISLLPSRVRETKTETISQ